MKTVRVNASKKYDVIIGQGIIDRAGEYVFHAAGGETAAIITDDIVSGLFLDQLTKALRSAGYAITVFTINNGEVSKSASSYIRLMEHLAESKLTRSDVIVALGGGVVGDLAGFAAATYMRGVHFVQVPTTLLAAVDSSVGGKTAIDLESGKNLAGAFYQPDVVICDTSTISNLPPRVFVDGCAEVIKYGMIADGELFRLVEDFPRFDHEEIIARCVRIKRDIVGEDEFDNGVRRLLNFGHTVGHAVEKLSGFAISHGKAVAIGMAVVTQAAVKMRMCDEVCYRDLVELLHKIGLPYSTRYGADELAGAALADKKRRGDMLALIVPQRIGKCIVHNVNVADLGGIIALGLE